MSLSTDRPVLCITGPTATGKSDLGVEIAKAIGGEILSADSMQIYRGMDIGTAKLSRAEMQGIPHHLMDVVQPDEAFSVADWTLEADKIITELHANGKLPIVVGGTGLYIRAITDDLNFFDRGGSAEIRKRWQQFAEEHGNAALHAELHKRDASTANRLHPNDRKRVVRAMELLDLNQAPMSESYDWKHKQGRYHTLQYALEMDRDVLYDRANKRVQNMMDAGLYEEVKDLLEKGYSPELPSMQAIGYKEVARCILGHGDIQQAVADVQQATRRYVKRQLSWFKRDPRVIWLQKDRTGTLSQDAYDKVLHDARILAAGIPVHRHE